MSHTSSISVPAFLLFPRQQRQRIFPRRTQPMALAVVWVVVLLGSVELAASVSVCACTCSEQMDGAVCIILPAFMHAFVHCNIMWLTHHHVIQSSRERKQRGLKREKLEKAWCIPQRHAFLYRLLLGLRAEGKAFRVRGHLVPCWLLGSLHFS